MSISAANSAGLPQVSLCIVGLANESAPSCNGGGELHPYCDGHASSNRAAIAANFRSQCADDNFALERVCRYVSRLMLGHRFGAFPAPSGTDRKSAAERNGGH